MDLRLVGPVCDIMLRLVEELGGDRRWKRGV
jgi:hypothetical protein